MNYQGRLYMGLHDCSKDRIERPKWRDGSQERLKPEVVHVTIGKPAFLPHLLFNVHFRYKLQHFGHVGKEKPRVDQLELEKNMVSDCKEEPNEPRESAINGSIVHYYWSHDWL